MDQPIQLALPFTVSKRWRDRAERWVTPGALFDPSRYGVDAVRRRDYAPFVANHHYSGSCTQGAWAYGLYRATARDVGLGGVAVFNRSTSERVLPSHTGFDAAEDTELGRLVLLDDVPYNGESFFLARALRLLRAEAPGLRVVVSFAGPMERRDPVSGALCKAAHWGVVYQASNAYHTKRTHPRVVYLGRDGHAYSDRKFRKIRNGTQGWRYAERDLVALGARPRQPGEDPSAWLDEVLAIGVLTGVKHPGTLGYAFGLDRDACRRIEAHVGGRKPYPRPAA